MAHGGPLLADPVAAPPPPPMKLGRALRQSAEAEAISQGAPRDGIPSRFPMGIPHGGFPIGDPPWGIPHGGSPMEIPHGGIPHSDYGPPQSVLHFFCGNLHSKCVNEAYHAARTPSAKQATQSEQPTRTSPPELSEQVS